MVEKRCLMHLFFMPLKREKGENMAVQEAGLSTLGVKFGYAVETVADTKPSAFTWLERCNSIAGIALSTETIDASALEDYITKYIAGRQDSGKVLAA